MNRHQRRRGEKLARDAGPDDIFPAGHGPVQRGVVDIMTAAVDDLRKHLGPNFDVTLFVAERLPPADEDRLPRFNYMSTACREDMLAVLDAFVLKNREVGEKVDKIADKPPTDAKQ
jgi:hypothetical protein